MVLRDCMAFFFFGLLEMGFYCVVLAGLEFPLQLKFTYSELLLSLPGAGLPGMCHPARPCTAF